MDLSPVRAAVPCLAAAVVDPDPGGGNSRK